MDLRNHEARLTLYEKCLANGLHTMRTTCADEKWTLVTMIRQQQDGTQMNRRTTSLTCVMAMALLSFGSPQVFAEVRFGKNVRIGGHDVSGQTFDKNNRGRFYLYNKQPPKPGCYWRKNSDGSRSKVCHLKRKSR